MKLSNEQRKSFEEASEPLVKFMRHNCDPHMIAIVDNERSELLGGLLSVRICVDWADCEHKYNGCKRNLSSDLCCKNF
jgi:hypothetical protein